MAITLIYADRTEFGCRLRYVGWRADTWNGRPVRVPMYEPPPGTCLICLGRGGCGWFEDGARHWTPCWACQGSQ